jgi:hypothetical protein
VLYVLYDISLSLMSSIQGLHDLHGPSKGPAPRSLLLVFSDILPPRPPRSLSTLAPTPLLHLPTLPWLRSTHTGSPFLPCLLPCMPTCSISPRSTFTSLLATYPLQVFTPFPCPHSLLDCVLWGLYCGLEGLLLKMRIQFAGKFLDGSFCTMLSAFVI